MESENENLKIVQNLNPIKWNGMVYAHTDSSKDKTSSFLSPVFISMKSQAAHSLVSA